MAITETYVDPAIAGASGAGTVGDPYGDLQHALDTMTRDATNGDRINIKAGTDEILGAAIDLSTYGTPAATAQLVFQGYTTAAADGGIGGISGAATYSVFNSTTIEWISFVDLHCHNSGSETVIQLDRYGIIAGCEIDNTSGNGVAFQAANGALVTNCYIHNIGGVGVNFNAGGFVYHCYFENGTNDFTNAVNIASSSISISFCIFNLDGASNGVFCTPFNASYDIRNNTFYSASGTGKAIVIDNDVDSPGLIASNYIEGFSGAGGVGINSSASDSVSLISNRYYNNTTHRSDGVLIINTDNSATAASALTNPGGGDFSVGTDLKAGAYPTTFKGSSTSQYVDIGAAQRQEPAGGGGGRRPRIRAHGV